MAAFLHAVDPGSLRHFGNTDSRAPVDGATKRGVVFQLFSVVGHRGCRRIKQLNRNDVEVNRGARKLRTQESHGLHG